MTEHEVVIAGGGPAGMMLAAELALAKVDVAVVERRPDHVLVGSRTLSGDLEWNATVLEGDLEDSVPKLKSEADGDLFMHGSGEFAHALAERGLVDEFEVYLNPLVWGEGNVHVLGDRGTVRLELDDVKRFDSGVVLLTYRPAQPA